MSTFETLEISCKDGYSLSGRFYAASTPTKHLPILICPATGITQNFYQAFAEWLSTQGYDVLSFDFRGIGRSLHGPISKSKASIADWGQLDIPAAIDTLLCKTQAEQVILLGHSAGGQLLGIVPNHEKVAKVVAISGSTGHVKGLKGKTKLLAPVMFNVIFPLARITKGYGPTQAIGRVKTCLKMWLNNGRNFAVNRVMSSTRLAKPYLKIITLKLTARLQCYGLLMMKLPPKPM